MRAPVDVTGYAAPVRAVMRTARLLALSLVALAAQPAAAEDPAAARQNMVREIESQARSVRPLLGERAGIDAKVLKAMERVRRHLFVPPAQRRHAYENRPLPIGFGQTISQPYIVALMTDLLGLEPGQKVLEIGTGSGYQAAVLAVLGAEVYSIEIISELGAIAAERFDRLGPPGDDQAGGRLFRLAGPGPVRRHHRHRGSQPRAAAAGPAAQAGGQDGDPGRRPLPHSISHADRQA